MWDNIGGKIKGLAKVFAWIGIICSIIGGIVLFVISSNMRYNGGLYFGLGFVVIIIGSLISWISAWVMYGFGELIENTDIIAYNSQQKVSSSNVNTSSQNTVNNPLPINRNYGDTWVCKNCNEKNSNNINTCKGCGAYK